MNHPSLGALLLTGLVAFTSLALAEDIYKWTDAKGQVHYGSNPPVGSNATLVETEGAPDANAVKEAEAINSSITGATTANSKGAAPSTTQAQGEACKKAQEEYQKLASTPKVSIKNADGKMVPANNDQRSDLLKEKQEAVTRACESGASK